MPLRFGVCAQLLANESQIVVRIGIVRLKADRLAEMLPCRFRPSGFFQHASQIEMGQRIFGIYFESPAKVFGGLLEIAILVAKRSAIDERLGLSGIDAQSAIVRVDRFEPPHLTEAQELRWFSIPELKSVSTRPLDLADRLRSS